MQTKTLLVVIVSCLYILPICIKAQAPWNLGGNTAGATNYIGTNDTFDFPVYTSGTQKMIVSKEGNVGIGSIDALAANPLYPRNKLLVQNFQNWEVYSYLGVPGHPGMNPTDIAIIGTSINPGWNNLNCGIMGISNNPDSHISFGVIGLADGERTDFNNPEILGNVGVTGTARGAEAHNVGVSGDVMADGTHALNQGLRSYARGNSGATNIGISSVTQGTGTTNTGIGNTVQGTGSVNMGLSINVTDNGSGSTNTGADIVVDAITSNPNKGVFSFVTGSTTRNIALAGLTTGNGSNSNVKANFGTMGGASGEYNFNYGVRGEISAIDYSVTPPAVNYSNAHSYNIGVAGDVADVDPGNYANTILNVGVYGIQQNAAHNGNTTVTGCASCPVDLAGLFEGDVLCSNTYYASDPKLKENIGEYKNAIEQLTKIQVKTYTFRNKEYPQMNLPQGTQVGVLSTNLKEVFPNLVKHSVHPPRNKEDKRVDFEAVNYNALIPVLIQAVKELDTRNVEKKDLEKKIGDQEDMIRKLSNKLDALTTCIDELCSLNPVINGTGTIDLPGATRLFQSFPNPATKNAVVRYFIAGSFSSAVLLFTDVSGSTIMEYNITAAGEGSVAVNTDKWMSGTYKYSLVINGRVVDTRTMAVLKD
jgi:hypothetical protein